MTWNVSIAIRSLCVTLLAAILALVLVVTLAEDADARRVRRKKGVADFRVFQTTFEPPDRFHCSPATAAWHGRHRRGLGPTDQYSHQSPLMATSARPWAKSHWAQAEIFDLNDVLDRGAGPGLGEIQAGKPAHPGESGPPPGPLATPDLFKCHWVPNAVPPDRNADDFSCEFPENQQTCVFTLGLKVVREAYGTCSWPLISMR